MSIRLALAGTGSIARVHARAAGGLSGVELTAIVNHRPESMAAFAGEFGIPRQYADVDALVRGGVVDALVVCTPNYLHAPQTIAALEAGVHVMVEKPMAMNAAEGEAMLSVGRETGALLVVAHCWRFDEQVRWLREQVAAGRLGRVIRTKSYGVHVNWGPSGWFTEKRLAGGGALADMGIHAIDTVRYLLGDPEPVSVWASIGTHYGDYDVDDTGIVMITWEGGASSYVESGWWQPHADALEGGSQLYGTAGYGQVFPTFLDLHNADRSATERVDPGVAAPGEEHASEAMYRAQMAHFLSCIDRGVAPKPGGLEGWTNMRVVDAAYESARTGKVVFL